MPRKVGKAGTKRTVPHVRSEVAAAPPRAEPSPVSQAAARGITRRPAGEALAAITHESRSLGWGFRHLALGASGSGKTYWLDRVAQYAVAKGGVDLALVHDAKDPVPQYTGTVRATVAELAVRPPARGDAMVIVLHERESRETADGVAGAGLSLARSGVRVLVLIDELYDALKGRQAFVSGTTGPISEILRKGRSLGCSIACSTQIPQTMPTEVLDLSDTIALFRLDSRSLAYVESALGLDAAAVEIVPRLQRGECILIRRGHDWDGVIYGPA